MGKKYVLITGGAGFIGSYICKLLVKEGKYTPVIVDLFAQYLDPIKFDYSHNRYERFQDIKDKIVLKRANCANYSVMHSIIEEYKPEYIIHLAAIPLARINDSSPEDFLEGTVEATANILNVVYNLKNKGHDFLKKFLYTSSSMIYGDFKEDSVKETHPTNPRNVYGTMKLAGENITRGLCNTYGINYVIIRPSAVYGPTDMNRRVSQIFVENAASGKKLLVMGGKDEKLDFSFVKDVAKGFVQALFSDCTGDTFNITGGNARSLYDFANIVKKYYPKTEIELVPRDKSVPKRGTLDISKAKKLFGFNPDYSLEEGIKEYVEYILKNKN